MKTRMNKRLNKQLGLYILLGGVLLSSCQKAFLAKKPDKSLLVPSTLADFQALLDNQIVFNISPGLPVISADDFQATDVAVSAYANVTEKNSYIWAADLYAGQSCFDWNFPYQQVFYANIVLDGLGAVPADAASQGVNYNTIRGSALFYRAFAFYNLVQLFARGYDGATAASDPGIPLRLSADVNLKAGRATVQQTYDQVLIDLSEAEGLLPVLAAYQSRPTKEAAEGLLARVYLSMGKYNLAQQYASAALKLNHTLTDYNTLDTVTSNPFPYAPANNNPETLFFTKLIPYASTTSTSATVSEELYDSYAHNDLRRAVFFSGSTPNYFKGRYTGTRLQLFGGLAVDELYLIRAECLARSGDVAGALADLNTLLVTRWRTGTFVPLTAANADEALVLALRERRKELAFRGLRWGDLKRLNNDPRFAVTLSRKFNGTTYTLLPGDKRYVLPIPVQEIQAGGIAQNER
jgi:tetratricopeptide (TPR) repeat protein